MQRLVMTSIFALGIATGASAQVLPESQTPLDGGETNYEETVEFIGNPVFTKDGAEIGTVSSAYNEADGDRVITVIFNDTFMTEFEGWKFTLDDKWETSGQLVVLSTEDELRSWIVENHEYQTQDS